MPIPAAPAIEGGAGTYPARLLRVNETKQMPGFHKAHLRGSPRMNEKIWPFLCVCRKFRARAGLHFPFACRSIPRCPTQFRPAGLHLEKEAAHLRQKSHAALTESSAKPQNQIPLFRSCPTFENATFRFAIYPKSLLLCCANLHALSPPGSSVLVWIWI